jgi:hypothetical protein
MISHELKTPLMGVLQQLELYHLQTDPAEQADSIHRARKNAERLRETLESFIDHASMKAGVFHARLREVDFVRLCRAKVLREPGNFMSLEVPKDFSAWILADPQKLSRAIDLVVRVMRHFSQDPAIALTIEPGVQKFTLGIQAQMSEDSRVEFETLVKEAQKRLRSQDPEGEIIFERLLQSEEMFLTETDGKPLGGEFLLVAEILRLHQSDLQMEWRPHTEHSRKFQCSLRISLSDISRKEALEIVLSTRLESLDPTQGRLGSLAVVRVELPRGWDFSEFRDRMRRMLFRSHDAVYGLPDAAQGQGVLALLLEDCKREDIPKLLARLEGALGLAENELQYRAFVAPDDGVSAREIIAGLW